MSFLKIVLAILASGLEYLKNNQLLQAGRAEQREKEDEATIKALAARDSVDSNNADKFLLPPDQRT